MLFYQNYFQITDQNETFTDVSFCLCAEHGTNLTDANKKLLKHQKQEKVLRDEVKALKKVLHTTKNELSKQQMENQQLKMQSLYEN